MSNKENKEFLGGYGCLTGIVSIGVIFLLFLLIPSCSTMFKDDCDVDLMDFNFDGDIGVSDYDTQQGYCD
ncbi:hypothetical protein H4O14_16740 [Bacillus sp. PAMC26568]|nr:hypothetical protein H4O14_16740 [Bacillus sp. PAMC26568]